MGAGMPGAMAGPPGWELKNTTDEPGYAKADAEHPDPPQDAVDLGREFTGGARAGGAS